MKRRIGTISVLLILTLGMSIFAQNPVLNSGFEEWGAVDPVNWWTSNLTGLAVNVLQTSDAHAGASALMGEVVDFSGSPWPPVVVSGSFLQGFPVTMRHATVEGYYKFAPEGTDQLEVFVSIQNSTALLGSGFTFISTPADNYTHFSVDIDYIAEGTPTTCILTFAIVGLDGEVNIGSKMYLDDISLEGLVGIETGTGVDLPREFALYQNYPNPFNPTTTINYQLAVTSSPSIVVYDISGRRVKELAAGSRQPAGTHTIQWDGTNDAGQPLGSGVYFYQLTVQAATAQTTSDFTQTRKMMLVR